MNTATVMRADSTMPPAYNMYNNATAMYIQRVGEVDIETFPKYAPRKASDTVVSGEHGASELILRLSARLHYLDAEIRELQSLRKSSVADASELLTLFSTLTSRMKEFNFLMYFYFATIEHEFRIFEYPTGFFTLRDQRTVVVTQEAMQWIGAAALRPVDQEEVYAFQLSIVLSPLASE